MTGEVQQIQDDGQSWEICSAREILGDKKDDFAFMKHRICGHSYTGKNWQVQFSVKGEDYMFAAPINIFSLHILRSRQIGLIDFRCLPLTTCGHLYCWTHIMDDYGKFNIVHKI